MVTGNVQDRYIFGGTGADQIVGRAVCGLPITSKNFAILPPHFATETIVRKAQGGWDQLLPG